MSQRPRTKARLEAARARMYYELIFESAERVFADHGFDESTMKDVAAEAGVSLKTLYATFPGKNEIFEEIQAQRGRAFLELIRGESSGGSALERLDLGIRAIARFLVEHRPYFRILLKEGHAWGLDPRADYARDSWRQGVGSVTDILRQGVTEGVFHDDLDPALTSMTVMSVIQVQLAGLLERTERPDPDALADRILVVLRRMLCVRDALETAAPAEAARSA